MEKIIKIEKIKKKIEIEIEEEKELIYKIFKNILQEAKEREKDKLASDTIDLEVLEWRIDKANEI